jgi:arginine N-succinyltransferase
LRSATLDDLDDLYALAAQASLGVTNLPKDRDLLKEKLIKSEQSFNQAVKEPRDEVYIFALENTETNKVIGTSAILASSHYYVPAPYFRKMEKILQLYFDQERVTELCGLFLRSDMRHLKGGRLLSFGRLLFIAERMHRFQMHLSADLRGYIEPNGNCPFWDAIVRPYCPVPFEEAIDIYINRPEELIKRLPTEAIDVSKLPQDVQDLIGKVHESSAPAQHLLKQENFIVTNDIHPLDGGPRMIARANEVRAIQNSSVVQVTQFIDIDEEPNTLISTHQDIFRASTGVVIVNDEGVSLSKQLKEALQIQEGDFVRIVEERA